ncbi:MAG: alpha/beta hydrolase [Methylobacter sp.]
MAHRVSATQYHYPYKDPLLATLTYAIMQGSEKPASATLRDLSVKILDHRDDIPLLEGMGTLRYSFYQQSGSAPLVFVIPGLGGSAYSGAARFLAEWLAGNDFHVIAIPSPFNWNFALSATASGYPGFSVEDTEDIYRVMQSVLHDVKNRYNAQIEKIGVLGFSDGALYTGYLSQLDAEKKQIGIDKFLLINPPVDLFKTARKIDQMARIGKRYTEQQKQNIEAYAVGVQADAVKRDINSPDYFADWDQRLKLNKNQRLYLIGKTLHEAIGDAIYVVDLANNAGILTAPIDWNHRDNRLEQARSYGLIRYAENFLIPKLRKTGNKQSSFETLNQENSLKAIAPALERNPSVSLMHNLDDVLIPAEDVAFLEKIFGRRAMIYPHGGHLGNLWYPDNKQHILAVFGSLLSNAAYRPEFK